MGSTLRFISQVSLTVMLAASAVTADPRPLQIKIPGGSFIPLLKTNLKLSKVTVEPFILDQFPVTRAQYQAFIRQNLVWDKSRTAGLMSDSQYLSSWRDSKTPPRPTNAPVTFVSWFAARAYCAQRGARLPTAAEWEYVAIASETAPDGRADPRFTEEILHWYANQDKELKPVGQHKNFYNVYDLHGLIWEWVEDFNGEFTSGDSRGDGSAESAEFCGAAALKVNEQTRRDYAAFMRYAFRGSLRGNYSIWNLGFRCARSG